MKIIAMKMITTTIIYLLFGYSNANGCEDFCIEDCSVLNGNYTNECQNCTIDYLCNPLSEAYIEPWLNNNITVLNNTIKIIDTTTNLVKYSKLDYFIMKYYKDKDKDKEKEQDKEQEQEKDNLTNQSANKPANQYKQYNQYNQYKQNLFINLLDYTNNTFWNLSDSWIKVKNYLDYLEL